MASRNPAPDHLLIEASGVALPGAIAATVTLVPGFANDGIVVLADAEAVRERAADRYLGDTIERQLRDAGLLLLTKPDLVPPEALAGTREWLQRFAPTVVVERGALPLELLFGPGMGKTREAFAAAPPHPAYRTLAFDDLPPLDAHRLLAVLTDPANGVLRAKGFVRDRGGATYLLQVAGKRGELVEAAPDAAPRLICLGLETKLDIDAVTKALLPG